MEMQSFGERFHRARVAWLAPLVVAAVVACDEGLGPNSRSDTWGFVTIAAAKTQSGQHVTVPEAFFFVGNLIGVPNAAIVLDSCADASYNPNNDLTGVEFLDAGVPLTLRWGGRTDTLPRVTGSAGITYRHSGDAIPYNPGDSVVVNVPGALGGYPTAEIRGKTAEPFTLSPIVRPSGTDSMEVRWSLPHDQNSAMIVSLRYSNSSGAARQVLCSFVDDGLAYIPFRQYQPWSNNGGRVEDIVATRLRTTFRVVRDDARKQDVVLEIISTYQVPTPVP